MDSKEYVEQQIVSAGVITLKEIAKESGVGYSWLKAYAKGQIPDPAYSRIKLLEDYFLRAARVTSVPQDKRQHA